MNAINTVLGWIRQVIGLIFPLFQQAADFSRWGKWAWYVLHAGAILGIVAVLYYLNNYVQPIRDWLFRMLRSKRADLTDYFLPVAFLLTYALAWVLRWIWLLLGPDAENDDYPDVTAAFREGLDRLATKGVRAVDLPLYLVVGNTKAGLESLFQAGQVGVEVFGPARGEPPVRVWASRSAIYVTAPGASALGKFADLMQRGPTEDATSSGTDAAKKTLGLGDDESLDATVQEINALRALARTRELTADEKARMRELATTAQNKPKLVKPGLSADQARLAGDRLRYLCQLIARERRPFCPMNGVLALINWESIESDEPVKSAALALRTDLHTVRAASKQCAPSLGLVCDLEEARGFTEFRAGFSAEHLNARIGQRFPLVPDAPPHDQSALYDSGATWLGERLFPGRVYQSLQLDVRDPRSLTARNLFHVYRAVHERLPRLGRLLRTGLPVATGNADGLDGPLLFAGCYVAGTGRDANQQAFVPGVFERLKENEGMVAWTPGAVAEDGKYARSATAATIAVALAAVGLLAAVWGLWKMK
ncbi:MAG: hypothetical protein K1X57_20415 [Gemmataceae bacterium]|nr:hypothetical protein [Gemmataceae bacterium]